MKKIISISLIFLSTVIVTIGNSIACVQTIAPEVYACIKKQEGNNEPTLCMTELLEREELYFKRQKLKYQKINAAKYALDIKIYSLNKKLKNAEEKRNNNLISKFYNEMWEYRKQHYYLMNSFNDCPPMSVKEIISLLKLKKLI